MCSTLLPRAVHTTLGLGSWLADEKREGKWHVARFVLESRLHSRGRDLHMPHMGHKRTQRLCLKFNPYFSASDLCLTIAWPLYSDTGTLLNFREVIQKLRK